MQRRSLLVSLVAALLVTASSEAQFSGFALYEAGAASTEIGEGDGSVKFLYGFGAGASYRFGGEKAPGFLIGADLLVRGFGIEVPGRANLGPGVFDQSDLLLDQFVAVRFERWAAGAYFEQRRIDRGVQLGTIEFPASGVGAMGIVHLGRGERTVLRISYAQFLSGKLRLRGSEVGPELDSGRSLRLAVRFSLNRRWGVRGEFADTKMELVPTEPFRSLLDHRQQTLTVGAVLVF